MSETEWMKELAHILGYFELPEHLREQAQALHRQKLLPHIAAIRIKDWL